MVRVSEGKSRKKAANWIIIRVSDKPTESQYDRWFIPSNLRANNSTNWKGNTSSQHLTISNTYLITCHYICNGEYKPSHKRVLELTNLIG